MKDWNIELVTNENTCNLIGLQAETVEKVDHQTLLVDGVCWQLPNILGISFAQVKEADT